MSPMDPSVSAGQNTGILFCKKKKTQKKTQKKTLVENAKIRKQENKRSKRRGETYKAKTRVPPIHTGQYGSVPAAHERIRRQTSLRRRTKHKGEGIRGRGLWGENVAVRQRHATHEVSPFKHTKQDRTKTKASLSLSRVIDVTHRSENPQDSKVITLNVVWCGWALTLRGGSRSLCTVSIAQANCTRDPKNLTRM